MDRTERVVGMARRRLTASALVDGAGRGLAWGATIGAGLVLGGKLFRTPWGDAWWLPLVGATAAFGLAGSLAALRARRSALDAAVEVDRRLGLKDRLSTATALGATPLTAGGAFCNLAIEESDRASAGVDVRRAVPLVWGRSWQLWPALACVAISIGALMPTMALRRESSMRAAELARTRAAVSREIANAQKVARTPASAPPAVNSAETNKAGLVLEEVQRELSRGTIDPAAAAERGSRALEQSAVERERSAAQEELAHEQLLDDLARAGESAKTSSGSAPGPLADAIRRGDLAAAGNVSRDLLNTGSEHSDTNRARAAAELEALARDLRDAEQARRAAQRTDAHDSKGTEGVSSTQNEDRTQTPGEVPSTSSQQTVKDRQPDKRTEGSAARNMTGQGSPQSQTEQLASAIEQAARDLRRESTSSAAQHQQADRPASPTRGTSAQAPEQKHSGAESAGRQDAGTPRKSGESGAERPGLKQQELPDGQERRDGPQPNTPTAAESKTPSNDQSRQRSTGRSSDSSHGKEEPGSPGAGDKDPGQSLPGDKTQAPGGSAEQKDAASAKREQTQSAGARKQDRAASEPEYDNTKSGTAPTGKPEGDESKLSPSAAENADRSPSKNPSDGSRKETTERSASNGNSALPRLSDGKPQASKANDEMKPEAGPRSESREQAARAPGETGKENATPQFTEQGGQTPQSRDGKQGLAPDAVPHLEDQPSPQDRSNEPSKSRMRPAPARSDQAAASPAAGEKAQNDQRQPGADQREEPPDPNAHDQPKAPLSQSQGQEASGPTSPSRPGDGVRRLADTLERLEKQPQQAAEARRDARRLRQQAQDMLRSATPQQRQELQRWARELAKSQENRQPGMDQSTDAASRSPSDGGSMKSEVAAQPDIAKNGAPLGEGAKESRRDGPSMAGAKSDPVDARASSGRRTEESRERVIAEWYSDSKPGREGGGVSTLSAEGEQAVRSATRAGEHALEADAVPSRYDGLLRRYFRRLGDRAGSPQQGVSSVPNKRTEPARDAGEATPPTGAAPKP